MCVYTMYFYILYKNHYISDNSLIIISYDHQRGERKRMFYRKRKGSTNGGVFQADRVPCVKPPAYLGFARVAA